jgi:uncharacterized membrane protein
MYSFVFPEPCTLVLPNISGERLEFLLRIREIPYSNLGHNIEGKMYLYISLLFQANYRKYINLATISYI